MDCSIWMLNEKMKAVGENNLLFHNKDFSVSLNLKGILYP